MKINGCRLGPDVEIYKYRLGPPVEIHKYRLGPAVGIYKCRLGPTGVISMQVVSRCGHI